MYQVKNSATKMYRLNRIRIALLEILFAAWIGLWFDRYYETGPWLMVTGILLGMLFAGQHLLSSVNAGHRLRHTAPADRSRIQLVIREHQTPRRSEAESIY